MTSLYEVAEQAGLLDSPAPLKGQGGPGRGGGRKPEGAARKETTSLSLAPSVLTAARTAAAARGESLSKLVERLLRAELNLP